MQIDLQNRAFKPPTLPQGYRFHPWQRRLLEAHADAKSRSFHNELDCHVFPCLGEIEGCRQLMKEISCRQGFVPQATWLATYQHPVSGRSENCGTVQGISDRHQVGAIQNIGITQGHRGRGIGSQIIYRCLDGFLQAGIPEVTLEVTAHNLAAIRLYEKIGFRITRTVFKLIEIPN